MPIPVHDAGATLSPSGSGSSAMTPAASDPSCEEALVRERSELRGRVQALHALMAETRRGMIHRDSIEEELALLRRLWRRNSLLFEADTIAMLTEISASLRSSTPAAPSALATPAAPSASATAPTPEQVLRDVFGYPSFRPGQRELIDAVLAGRDAVGIMPTGSGKSIAFQVPARVLGGITLVVSPLIALMKDQVDSVNEVGLRATFLNSSLSYDQKRSRIERIRRGDVELVYAAPEGLQASVGAALSGTRLSLIAVDEAHCISTWGHDFRPAYRDLAGMKQRFGGAPVLALTATATEIVTRDIIEQLEMQDPTLVRTSFYRPNLRVAAHAKTGERGRDRSTSDSILAVVRAHQGESGIVYCLSRKSTETTARFLRENGCTARAYHAGLEPSERNEVQDAFCRDDVDVIVATIAFGMGIDKSNVRFVVHRDLPRSIEGYYQEIGRAGRDGLPSDCVLFYSWNEVTIYERFAADISDNAIAERLIAQARRMYRFAENRGCRHQALAAHFGEQIPACGQSCDQCASTAPFAAHPRRRPLADWGRPPREAKSTRSRGVEATTPATTPGHDAVRSSSPERAARSASSACDIVVFEQLRALRRRLADDRGVPAYVIMSDATLTAMAASRPTTAEALLRVPGIGPQRLKNYGDEFLAVLRTPPDR